MGNKMEFSILLPSMGWNGTPGRSLPQSAKFVVFWFLVNGTAAPLQETKWKMIGLRPTDPTVYYLWCGPIGSQIWDPSEMDGFFFG